MIHLSVCLIEIMNDIYHYLYVFENAVTIYFKFDNSNIRFLKFH